jgi:hypothetical protein
VRRPDLLVATLMVAVFAAMAAGASTYPIAARLLPLTVGVPACALALWELIAQWRTTQPVAPARPAPGVVTGFLWLLAFVAMLICGGFLIGGVVAVTVVQHFWLKESWRTAAIGGVVAFVVLFAGIERGLGQPLFEGLLIEWVRTWLGT